MTSSTTTSAPATRARASSLANVVIVALAALGLMSVVVALSFTGGAYVPSTPGLPDPGPLIGWGLPILRMLTDLAGALTVGWLLAAAFLDPAGRDGVVSPTGRADLIRAVMSAGAWAILALLQMFFLLGQILGVTLDRAMSPGIVGTYAWDVPSTRALALMVVVAAVISLGALFTASVGVSAIWAVLGIAGMALPAIAGHASGLGDHALAISAGIAHAMTATVWIGGVFVLLFHGLRRDAGFEDAAAVAHAARRFGVIALVCFVLLAASGAANAYTRLDTVDQLLTTNYGLVVTGKIALLLGLLVIASIMRRRLLPALAQSGSITAFLRIIGLEIGLIVVAFGMGVALALSPFPRVESLLPTYGESLLGFRYPPPPDVAGILLGFRLEPVWLIGGIAGAALYIAGIVTLRTRGDRWPWGRTLSWMLGICVLIWATNAGISVYSQVSMGWHMVQHMTLAMLAPMLLVLGAPFTLALRALPTSRGNQRNLRDWIVWGLHSTVAKIVTNPIFVFLVFSGSMFALYFTPLLGTLMGSHIGHLFMQFHFIASGYLFAWIIMGIDPVPKPLPYWMKFGLILLMIGVHGLFAVIVMQSGTPLAQEWFGVVRPDWVVDPMADTEYGGQVAWGISEIPMLFMVIMVVIQWARSDDREAARQDRQADRDGDAELNAYNAYLASLDQRSRDASDR